MLSETLKTAREKKKISLKKLAEKTGVMEKLLAAVEQGDFSSLPADVFMRGYLKKIAEILKLDSDEIWKEYAAEKNTGSEENYFNKKRLAPTKKNRLIFRKLSKSFPLSVFILVIFIFVIFQASKLFGSPELTLNNPASDMITKEETIFVSGNGPKNSYLKINGKEIYLGETGSFNEELYLNIGINEISVEAKNRLGKTKTIRRIVTRE